MGGAEAKNEPDLVKSGGHIALHERRRVSEHLSSLDSRNISRRSIKRAHPGVGSRLPLHQKARLYVKMNGLATQSRIGGANFALRISRSAVGPSVSSPVVLPITRVDMTFPVASTFASTVTRPCGPASENEGGGDASNR